MASSVDIATVRRNVNELTDDNGYTDAVIGSLIDASGVNAASATIWREKAAGLVEEVDVTEGGASHRFSDLHKNALAMASSFDKLADEVATPDPNAGRARVSSIVRET